MKVGIPKGLLYYKYYPFFENFFYELGAEVINSPDTSKKVLDEGVKYCVDEACLPVKVFHGHVASIKDSCDVMLIPRIMQLRSREYICPKFCGLPEMVCNSIPNMPQVIGTPIYGYSTKKLYNFAKESGKLLKCNGKKINYAFEKALNAQKNYFCGIKTDGMKLNVALVGHPYNIFDNYTNMNLVKKLNKLKVGVITEEYIDSLHIDNEVKQLFKRPFWSFARNSFGFASFMAKSNKVDGVIYISSFACGIDSVVIELIQNNIGDFPMLILKIDEQTGEAGLDTRIEAFVDMLARRG
ncbi:acyl-CoA dehydratase activase-related protein [Clostridium omnivorum]|uniref:2-hydroxyglutaryl-CoA dehydratase n=1 Tax=Clostridium omnivorum TaxID=1604902 RepID=A0ABQ5NA67_9CLOT|nr:acyl-CoA dehydratase activase-related protein [Clostridium sp. E14]GLC32158.1 2-hydroxyglutaryl-CoA dehydratase [Clostridium sp. E14]